MNHCPKKTYSSRQVEEVSLTCKTMLSPSSLSDAASPPLPRRPTDSTFLHNHDGLAPRLKNIMSRKRRSSANTRRLQFEQFEKRLVMSAQAIAPDIVQLLPELEQVAPAITGQDIVVQTNDAIDNLTLQNAAGEAAQIAAEYGFDGSGQTVAVIDTGIAYDHAAFGGGFGEGSQVVGGYDFAENDSNPYDDGPAGFHGTHVAGIIGSQDAEYSGISPGVDLVALRVFNDNGIGELELVEKALQFVIENKDSYRNPITTVNLSLGTGWNEANTPNWGILEDEFAQLDAAGIFISAAAGNSFQEIGDQALSYPAASPFVVPVASHGADGQLSDFSQRDDRVLVAPGEELRSSVPDHLFTNGREDAFLTASGTSQAAPWVAGASVILRQANEFVGNFGVTQSELYDQFVATSDQVYDAITNTSYSRINFRAALESVIGDHFGERLDEATSLGSLGHGDVISGTIGRTTDVDAIKFTAESSGRIELALSGTHELQANVNFLGRNATFDGNTISFDVEAGQEYGFELSTLAGTGHYELLATYQSASSPNASESTPVVSGPTVSGPVASGPTVSAPTVAATDLGAIVSSQFQNQSVAGQQTYHLTAVRDGILTVEAQSAGQTELQFNVYNQQDELIGTATGNGSIRIDASVSAGEELTIEVINQGGEQSFDLTVANLVSLEDGVLTLHGTNFDDVISVDATNQITANINGIEFQWANDSVGTIFVRGHEGSDAIDLNLGSTNDQVTLLTDTVHARNSNFVLTATAFDHSSVSGGGGFDQLYFVDSANDDQISAGQNDDGLAFVTLERTGESRHAVGFEQNYIASFNGTDALTATGSQQSDLFGAYQGQSYFNVSDQASFVFDSFNNVSVDGNGGSDVANLAGTDRRDEFTLGPNTGVRSNDQGNVRVDGFDRINAIASSLDQQHESGQYDLLELVDSAGDDHLYQSNRDVVLSGDDFHLYGQGFVNVRANSIGGQDRATILDTEGNDTFKFTTAGVQLRATDLLVYAGGFENVNFVATAGGNDRATIIGSAGDDVLQAGVDNISLTTQNGNQLQVSGVDRTFADLGAGEDRAKLTGGVGNDQFAVNEQNADFHSVMQFLRLHDFQEVSFDGNGGDDDVQVSGPIDLLAAIGDQATVVLENHRVQLTDFSALDVDSVDDAIIDLDFGSIDFTTNLRSE